MRRCRDANTHAGRSVSRYRGKSVETTSGNGPHGRSAKRPFRRIIENGILSRLKSPPPAALSFSFLFSFRPERKQRSRATLRNRGIARGFTRGLRRADKDYLCFSVRTINGCVYTHIYICKSGDNLSERDTLGEKARRRKMRRQTHSFAQKPT